MRTRSVFLTSLICAYIGACGGGPGSPTVAHPSSAPLADTTGTPRFDRIDYAHPEQYLALEPSLGSKEVIEKLASEVPRKDDERDQLLAIGLTLQKHLQYRDTDVGWRNVDKMLADGFDTGCADHAVFFGALSRALGIPTVWVKTLDVDFIRELVRTKGNVSSWRGHVFLEVHLRSGWALLDASQMVLYRDYVPKTRILPGNRYAYDKGGDPYTLILSSRGAAWKAQTRATFLQFDVSTLPVGGGEPLKRPIVTSVNSKFIRSPVFIVCNSPFCGLTSARLQELGVATQWSFNVDFERHLAEAVGHTLVVVVKGNDLVLPAEDWPHQTVITVDELKQAMSSSDSGTFVRKRPDGTTIVIVYGSDEQRLGEEIGRL